MEIINKYGIWRLFDTHTALIITDERQLANIASDPDQPFNVKDDRGFSGERRPFYDEDLSLTEFCRRAQSRGIRRLEVSYDFFFGGKERTNYPDSELTLKAFKVIHDAAKAHGMEFSASIINPLDIGGGYAENHEETGLSYQYQEGRIREDSGEFDVELVLQVQWTNNKGPIRLKVDHVKVFAFREERIEGTDLYVVNPDEIMEISETAAYDADERSVQVTRAGYGYGSIRVYGRALEAAKAGLNRCLAVVVYRTPELDYFSPGALQYMKEVIDKHRDAGISYQGFYSDEMHIQFDWDLNRHFGHEEIAVRYLTPHLMAEYARRYGERFKDFPKYLVYFSYHQHDFLEGEEGNRPNQHVMGKDEKSIYETWLFRKRYFEMLQDQVVGLSIQAKEYAEQVFQNPIMTRFHATWQESPTCDRFSEKAGFSELPEEGASWYDYTPKYVWSSSIRENISACYDYFKWGDFLTGGGTDHPEGGKIDRNYYAQALACSLGALNQYPYAYCADWGSPLEVSRRFRNVNTAYGNQGYGIEHGHDFVQGVSHRMSDVLALYPLELNYVEERFGSWMVQYGYCNYITEAKLLELATVTEEGKLSVNGREYRALVVLFEPFIREETLQLLQRFVECGGKLLWTSVPPALTENGEIPVVWKSLFGVRESTPAYLPRSAAGEIVRFEGALRKVRPMRILTDLLPDGTYPLVPSEEGAAVASVSGHTVGVMRSYPGGGAAVYLGFRPRDDQSASTGEDVDTLFSILLQIGAYDPEGSEAVSRPASSRYLIHRFPNGAISVANHYRTFEERWTGRFFRDEEEDAKALEGRTLPPVDIVLEGERLLGRTVRYRGTDVLSFRTGPDGSLGGFAGSRTTGITVDGKEYVFSDRPMDLAWSVMPEELTAPGISALCLIRAGQTGTISIPIPFGTGEMLHVELCDPHSFDTVETVPHRKDGGGIQMVITERLAGRWIAAYTLA